jgi:hypothetical protein
MAILGKNICMVLIICSLLAAPALAGTNYMGGSPDLSAYISGTTEFSPGIESPITIVIKNTGINEYKLVQSSTTQDLADLPNTAKFLTVSLRPGDAPLIVKTDPQMLGDLKGGSSTTATFITKIDTNAKGGTYSLPLLLNYSYQDTFAQAGATEYIEYRYQTAAYTLNIPITVKHEVSIDVLSAEPEHLNAGTEGYLNLTINNTGSEDGTQAIVKITRNGNSPVIPVDNSAYIGNFPSGSTVSCRYKVSVSSSAEKQTYPVDVVVEYLNTEGDTVTSRSDTVGVPIGGKADFAIISAPAEMHPGNKEVISVEYKNTGDTAIYSAQSRVSAVDPFSSSEDIAFIGDLQPGESRVVSYQVSVDRSATIKEYGLDSEIRYRDALDNTYISDIMKVNVNVTTTKGLETIISNPIYLSILAAIIIGIAYVVYHKRSRKQ